MKPFTLFSGIAMMALLAGGCTRQEQAKTEQAMRNTGEAAAGAAKTVGKTAVRALDTAAESTADAAVTGSVKTRLLADKWISATAIDVTTRNNVVTLNGKVPSAQQRVRASKVAQAVVGVKGVNNQLKVGK